MKNKIFKKFITGIVSAAMIATSVPAVGAASVENAAADPNYAEALELSLYFYDALPL